MSVEHFPQEETHTRKSSHTNKQKNNIANGSSSITLSLAHSLIATFDDTFARKRIQREEKGLIFFSLSLFPFIYLFRVKRLRREDYINPNPSRYLSHCVDRAHKETSPFYFLFAFRPKSLLVPFFCNFFFFHLSVRCCLSFLSFGSFFLNFRVISISVLLFQQQETG